MPSAALAGLFQPKQPSYRSLHPSDVEKLVWILRDQTPNPNADYWAKVRKAIQNLPSNLRSHSIRAALGLTKEEHPSVRVKPGKLCSAHSGLKADKTYATWGWVRREIDTLIGPFIWPVISNNGLPASMETQIRQLEPVAEMFHRRFDFRTQTPEGREPIHPLVVSYGDIIPKWQYQGNHCPACRLARIGGDRDVLFALIAGMVARFSAQKLGKKGQIGSARLRWVVAWLKTHDDGDRTANKAWDLGREVKRLRKVFKPRREGVGADFYGRHRKSVASTARGDSTRASTRAGTSVRRSTIGVDLSEGFQPGFQPAAPRQERPPSVRSQSTRTRTSTVGVDISDPFIPTSHHRAASTIRPSNSSSIYLDEPPRPAPSAIFSLESGVSTLGPEPAPILSQMGQIPEEEPDWWDQDEDEGELDDEEVIEETDLTHLIPPPLTPKPHNVRPPPPQSIYDGYCDVSPPETPQADAYWARYRGGRGDVSPVETVKPARREEQGPVGGMAGMVERELRGRRGSEALTVRRPAEGELRSSRASTVRRPAEGELRSSRASTVRRPTESETRSSRASTVRRPAETEVRSSRASTVRRPRESDVRSIQASMRSEGTRWSDLY